MAHNFKNKKVLVFGLGLNQGGVGSAKFFAGTGAEVRVTDLKTTTILAPSLKQLKKFKNISYSLGEHKYEDIDWADIIIKNPAVKPRNPYLEYAQKNKKQIETDMGIFLQYIQPDQLIGVTGTKGKSTTASLIYEILKAAKNDAIFAGNIGVSVLDTIPLIKKDTLIVLEISSFQLEAFKAKEVSPKWAVVTNITPDHLNYYETMEDYIQAKKIIGKFQEKTGYLFIRKDDPLTAQPGFLTGLKSQIIHYSKEDLPENFHPKLLGIHNLENMAAALAVTKAFGINEKSALNILAQFKGVPFRMELIKTWKGIKIYNDTTATSPSATIEALKALGPQTINEESNIILICGGMNKNMNYSQLGETISAKAVYFLEGDVVDEIICTMPDKSIIEGRFNNLKDLLRKLRADIQTRGLYGDIKKRDPYFKKGDIILFSPAATSFNLFQNEFDRGRKFNEAVEKVFK